MDNAISFNPYLFFDGTCREAMEFYQGVFGGKLDISDWGDNPSEEAAAMKGKVMHAHLQTDDFIFMAADTSTPLAKEGNRISLSLGGSDEARLTKLFDALSAGGTVKAPLKKEFWGDTFGMFADKFGVDWMVNISAPKEENA